MTNRGAGHGNPTRPVILAASEEEIESLLGQVVGIGQKMAKLRAALADADLTDEQAEVLNEALTKALAVEDEDEDDPVANAGHRFIRRSVLGEARVDLAGSVPPVPVVLTEQETKMGGRLRRGMED